MNIHQIMFPTNLNSKELRILSQIFELKQKYQSSKLTKSISIENHEKSRQQEEMMMRNVHHSFSNQTTNLMKFRKNLGCAQIFSENWKSRAQQTKKTGQSKSAKTPLQKIFYNTKYTQKCSPSPKEQFKPKTEQNILEKR